jgi:hypothetical protein
LTSLAGLILTLPVVLLGLPFWLMSWAVDLFARLTEPRVAARGELMRFDPVLGWKTRENLDEHYLVKRDDIYPIVTDSSGWPGRRTLKDSEIVVVGDSFAYGYGARKGESFAELDPELKIKAVACPGYDLVQELLLLRQLGDQLDGKLVVWFIYPENDLPDLLRPQVDGHRKPFVRKTPTTGEWEIVSGHLRPEPWRPSIERNNFRAFANICVFGPQSDRCYSACEFLLQEAADLCRRVGAKLIVFTIPNVKQLDSAGRRYLGSQLEDPSRFDARYPDRRLSAVCEKLGVPFIPGMDHLKAVDYKRFEQFHWTPAGHRKVARLLREIAVPLRDAATSRRIAHRPST